MKSALLGVDLLRDFCPGGALPAPGGERIVPVVNRLAVVGPYALRVLIQEQHPPNHIGFASRYAEPPFQLKRLPDGREQVLWPDHCVAGTAGCEPHPDSDRSRLDLAILKGQRPEVENYSGFADEDGRDTGLTAPASGSLHYGGQHCRDCHGCCVEETALHAVGPPRLLETRVVQDACAGIDANEGDVNRALSILRSAGVTLVTSDQVLYTSGGGTSSC